MSKPPQKISHYVKLKEKGVGRSKSKFLTPEQMRHKKEIAAQKNRLRQEARRRALMVLQHRYAKEYAEIYNLEQEFLRREKNDR